MPSSRKIEDMKKACKEGNVEKVKKLLRKSSSLVNEKLDENGHTPLHYASWQGKENVVKVLLAANADINAKTHKGWTPLHYASRCDHESIVKVLLAANADINAKTHDDWTPLHFASRYGYESVVKVLLAANADTNAKEEDGWTPLHFASRFGKENVVKVLLAANADIEAKTKDGWTPLHFASGYGHESGNVVQVLLAANADIEAKTKDGWTPLHFASVKEYGNVVQVLLAAKADIEAKNSDGWTPLHVASFNGEENVVKVLLAAKADIEAKNDYGETPLYVASRLGKENVVKVLLAANADIEAKDNDGNKPGDNFYDDVNESRRQQIRTMLEEERDRRNKKQQQGSTPSSSPKPSISKPPPSSASSSSPQASTPSSLPRSSATSQPPPSSASSSNSQTQEAEIKRKIKCKYEGHAIRFFLKKTTTFKELIATVEGEWGEGKGVMYKDEDGDWVKIRTNDDVVEMWDLGVVSLEVFSAQPNETSSLPTLSSAVSSASSASSSSTNTPPPSSSSKVEGQNSGSTLRQDDVGKEDLNNSVPIRGIWDNPLLSFEEAVQRAKVPNLKIDDIYSCLEHFEEVEDPPPGLTIDEACAVRFYTMETPFYGAFNSALRTRDRNESKPFFPFLQLLLLAMHKLPKAKGTLFRGTKNLPSSVIDEYKKKAASKKCVFWGACSSTTTSVATLQNEMFCGKEGNRVKFVIQNCEVGVSVEELSAIGVEKEVLLPPCLRLKVEAFVDYGNGLLEFQLSYSPSSRCEMVPVPPPQFLSSSS